MLDPNRPIFVATNGFVLALNPADGAELWRTKLGRSAGSIVSVMSSDGLLFAGHSGKVSCIDPQTGAVLWTNNLPKTGFHPVLLVREGAEPDVQGCVAASAEAEAQAAAAAGATAGAS
jgi:outer membrane protein assembly factor BamB